MRGGDWGNLQEMLKVARAEAEKYRGEYHNTTGFGHFPRLPWESEEGYERQKNMEWRKPVSELLAEIESLKEELADERRFWAVKHGWTPEAWDALCKHLEEEEG